MDYEDDQELQRTTNNKGEQSPVTRNMMTTEQVCAVPNGHHIINQIVDLNQRGVTAFAAKATEQNPVAQQQQQQQSQQLNQQQQRQQQSQFDVNTSTTSQKDSSVNISSANMSPEKQRTKRPRVVSNNSNTANTNSALPTFANDRFAVLDIDVPITNTHANTHSTSDTHSKNSSSGTMTRPPLKMRKKLNILD